MSEPQVAFNALVDLATRSRSAAKGLPSQIDVQQQWSGIGFSLLGQLFVAPMGEISELLEMPDYTQMPGVQPWVMGVANVRGRLLPLFDMAMFFGAHLDGQRKKHRVLVLEEDGLYSGLVVDAAMGMQHFAADSFDSDKTELNGQLQDLVVGSYNQNLSARSNSSNCWYVFSPKRLIEEPRFVNAAQ